MKLHVSLTFRRGSLILTEILGEAAVGPGLVNISRKYFLRKIPRKELTDLHNLITEMINGVPV